MNYIKKIQEISKSKEKTKARQIGNCGELIAKEYLLECGVIILGHNFSSKWGEIDLIGQEGERLLFIEVKTRKNANYGSPSDFVDQRKQERLYLTAQLYLQGQAKDWKFYRFDIIEIEWETSSLRWIKNAF